jgi:hypothetical protein
LIKTINLLDYKLVDSEYYFNKNRKLRKICYRYKNVYTEEIVDIIKIKFLFLTFTIKKDVNGIKLKPSEKENYVLMPVESIEKEALKHVYHLSGADLAKIYYDKLIKKEDGLVVLQLADGSTIYINNSFAKKI